MTIAIDTDGTIYLYQGDSGELFIKGLDNTKSYTACLAIQDSKRNLVGKELQVAVNNSDNVTFVLTPEFTDLLAVPRNKPFEVYYYGIKLCEKGSSKENTLFIADAIYGDVNRLIVYPRKVMGVENV